MHSHLSFLLHDTSGWGNNPQSWLCRADAWSKVTVYASAHLNVSGMHIQESLQYHQKWGVKISAFKFCQIFHSFLPLGICWFPAELKWAGGLGSLHFTSSAKRDAFTMLPSRGRQWHGVHHRQSDRNQPEDIFQGVAAWNEQNFKNAVVQSMRAGRNNCSLWNHWKWATWHLIAARCLVPDAISVWTACFTWRVWLMRTHSPPKACSVILTLEITIWKQLTLWAHLSFSPFPSGVP